MTDQRTMLASLPDWLAKIVQWKIGGASSVFMLWFNINDYVLTDNPAEAILPLRHYLYRGLREYLGYNAIFYYSRSTGLRSAAYLSSQSPGSELGQVGQLAGAQAGSSVEDEILQEHAGQRQQRGTPRPGEAHIDQLLQLEAILQDRTHQSAVIIDYIEKIAPRTAGEGRSLPEELLALEILQRWALDHRIRSTNNIVLLLTPNYDQVATPLHAADSGCSVIEIELPSDAARKRFLQRLAAARSAPPGQSGGVMALADLADDLLEQQAPDRSEAAKINQLAARTKGLSLVDLDNINRGIKAEARLAQLLTADRPIELNRSVVRQRKEELIKAQSQELLEIVTPVSDFDDIGGLRRIKQYLVDQSALIAQSSPDSMRGIILVGPPGTGKSIIAEALAKVSNVNMVKMRDIRSKWIGESEQNLTRVFRLILALSPVVVFVDEIDQAMGQRETGSSGDSGVGARMFGRILEFMGSNDYRGKVVWIAASNRPDLLDAAMLRRFDRVVPFLLPAQAERVQIFKVMKRQVLSRDQHTAHHLDSFYAADVDFEPIAAQCKGMTGAAIELIVRRAREIARGPINARHLQEALDDFRPNHNQDMYNFQSLLGLQFTNFRSMIPAIEAEYPYTEQPYKAFIEAYGENPSINSQKLGMEIAKLRMKLMRSNMM